MEISRMALRLIGSVPPSPAYPLLRRSSLSTKRLFTTSGATRPPLVETQDVDGIRVLKMNNPKRLNAWTESMLKSIMNETNKAIEDDTVKAVVFTGTGRYYCAGVDLGSTLRPMMPKKLHESIRTMNETVFNTFLTFPKPMVIAVNGHAVGASVTSATLADSIVALEGTTFSTPFAALGICPEGCSSVNFERIMGKEAAERMLGPEGWKPSAEEWHKFGVIEEVVKADGDPKDEAAQARNEQELVNRAVQVAQRWAAKGKRLSPEEVEELKAVNARESEELATCFLSEPFLKGQYEFAKSKGKNDVARLFYALRVTRPVWSLLL